MPYEYRVIPAPKRLKKIKGVSSTADLFAANLTDTINAEARDGWDYVRTESLAAEQPGGFLRRARMVEETVMIFRRPRAQELAREPALREPPRREAAPESAMEARGPATLREPAAERGRPLATLLARGDAPHPEQHSSGGAGTTTPPLLRPVPRHKPGDKP